MRTGFTALFAAALCAGCAEEAPDKAWVLLDAEARQSGVGIVIDGEEYAAALPIEVDADVELTILDGEANPTPLWTEPGAVHHVIGDRAEVWTGFVGVDVNDEAIEVFGDEDAAWRLADAVGGVIETTDEVQVLVAGVLYEELAVAEIVHDAETGEPLDVWPIEQEPPPLATTGERIREQAVDAVGDLGHRILGQVGGAATQLKAAAVPFDHNPIELDRQAPSVLAVDDPLRQVLDADRSAADLVGWYCHDEECVILGIDFTAQECADDDCTESTWRVVPGGVEIGPRFYANQGRGLNAGGVYLADMLEVIRD